MAFENTVFSAIPAKRSCLTMTGILWAVVAEPIALQPLFSNGQAHHVTLQYGVERKQYEHLIGLPMTVGVLSAAHNDRIQAISVVLPTWAPCQNIHPHITVSWVNGATPVEANAMLLSGEYQQQEFKQEIIHTIIEWLDWGEKPIDPRKWSDRASGLCPTCLNQKIETKTRSLSGYCRKHRNA